MVLIAVASVVFVHRDFSCRSYYSVARWVSRQHGL